MVEVIVFALFGAVLVSMALCVLFAQSPLRGALALIVALCSLAVLYTMLDAPFVAAMQILVYAGAIMVLFLFVIMLLNLGPDAMRRGRYMAWSKALGLGAAVYFVWRILARTLDLHGAPGRPLDGTVTRVGQLLLSDFLFNFEAISVLLLVAVVGAVVLGLKRLT